MLRAFLSFTAFLAVGLVGCGSDAEPTSEASDEAAASEFTISCHGDVTERFVSPDLSIRCVGGEPGARCGDACGAQELSVRYEAPPTRCGSVDVFAWDGTACVAYATNQGGTMICTGSDCANLFATAEACRAAYASCP